MPTSLSDATQQTELALLGSVVLDNSLWSRTEGLTIADFSLTSHQTIFGVIAAMREDGRAVDTTTLTAELAQRGQLEVIGGHAYIGRLIDFAMPENFDAYVRTVRTDSISRQWHRRWELMGNTRDFSLLREQLDHARELLADDSFQGYRSIFHSHEEIMNAPPAQFAIDGFLQEQGITLIGGLAGHGKTLTMLAIVRALLEGGKLFSRFTVTKKSERVVYLIPECGIGPFKSRLKIFNLLEHVRDERLLVRTLSAKGQLSLSDTRLLQAAKGADVFLDTAIRFMSGDESSAGDQREFAESLFSLQAAGARTIVGAHHAPKSFDKDSFMTLENILRGSGDIGAMTVCVWGLYQIDPASTRIYLQNVKARDFLPCEPFIIQGRPSIDASGYFEMTEPPGFAGELSDNKVRDKGGKPAMAGKEEKIQKAREMAANGQSIREIASALGVSKSSVGTWVS